LRDTERVSREIHQGGSWITLNFIESADYSSSLGTKLTCGYLLADT